MSDLLKIKLSDILANCQFWYPTFFLYFQSQGLTPEQIYIILTFYSISALVLEYPTGVISDYFSPRTSLICGYFAMAVSFFLQTFHGSFFYYCFLLFIAAIGFTLTTGSDTALLHSVSKNFKHDFSQVKMYSIAMTVLSSIVGGLTIGVNLRLSLYFTSFLFLVCALLLVFSRRYPYERITGNIFTGGLIGIRYVRENKNILFLIILASLVGGFFMSFKYFYAPLLGALHLPEALWGFVIAGMTLVSILGVRIYKSYSFVNFYIVCALLLFCFLLLGFTVIPLLSLLGLLGTFLLRGYVETKLDTTINEEITSQARSSILSLDSFITRLVSTAFTFVLGMLITRVSFFSLMIGTVLFLCAFGIYPLLHLRKV
jgi:MFS family permease